MPLEYLRNGGDCACVPQPDPQGEAGSLRLSEVACNIDPEQKALSSVPYDVPNVDFSGGILPCCPDELSVVPAVGHSEPWRRSA
jgi:hypothetical protein